MYQSPLIQTKENVIEQFNDSLKSLKELFHKTGRFDDANTKLDEIIKLLTIKFFDLRDNTNRLSLDSLRSLAQKKFGDKKNTAKALQAVFSEIAKNKIFYNEDDTNIFGANPNLNIQPVDNELAEAIIDVVNRLAPKGIGSSSKNLDFLNEAFGHFVRDNFRNHKEDAQYMTPVEVTDAMLEIALSDILKDSKAKENLFSQKKDSFIVVDPTCGVGTFLVRASQKIKEVIENSDIKNKERIIELRNGNSYAGQDKVDRMVRMSKVNFLFSGLNSSNIAQGNSILGKSFLNSLEGKVDLIVTNPPFGAEFSSEDIPLIKENLEVLPEIQDKVKTKTFNSELILLDRSLRLLKPGGRLLIIVPDSVVSSSGLYEIYRDYLAKKYILKGVIDLPSVTFAQAGTRTRCSILYIQKPYKELSLKQNGIFMAVADEIGYEVKEKMGSPVKFYKGKNDLEKITASYKKLINHSGPKVVNDHPSVVIYPFESLINGKWNANFYNANRISALNSFDQLDLKEFEVKIVGDVAEFVTKQRKKLFVSEKVRQISVLHINDDSSIRTDEVMRYEPTCAGFECKAGEIIFSKINPRIPRVAVVPPLDYILTCSSEFEIIKPSEERYTYLLKTLLLTEAVQKQIQSLTSGTSSSHNRIKSSELMNIQILWPKKESSADSNLLKLSRKIEVEEKQKYQSNSIIKVIYDQFNALITV